MPKHLKKISEEIIRENPWWKYKHDVYKKPDGTVGDYYYGETLGMVMIVPILEDGRIVLAVQYRYLEQKQSIEFPAGGIKKGQDAREAAKQELYEETGCIADEFVKMGSLQPANGFIRDETHIFLAHITECGVQHLDDTEEIELIYRRPEEIEKMIRNNDIWCGQTMATWALVHHYFLHKN